MSNMVLQCAPENITQSGECSLPVWAFHSSMFPALSVEDALALVGAFLLLHVAMFGVRMVVQLLLSSGANRF